MLLDVLTINVSDGKLHSAWDSTRACACAWAYTGCSKCSRCCEYSRYDFMSMLDEGDDMVLT